MKRTYIWGTGKIADYVHRFCKDMFQENEIIGYIDNDKKKIGSVFWNIPIYGPDVLENDRNCCIIILSASYENIEEQIVTKYPWLSDRIELPIYITKRRLISRYKNTNNKDILDIIVRLENNPLQVFNYGFVSKYEDAVYDVYYDEIAELYYTMFENKRMYFARFLDTEEKVQNYYRQIVIEQDIESPHRYLIDEFQVISNSVVVDAGVAEGNFALSIIDKVKRIYMFESNPDWIEALEYTFMQYKDKVVIVNKYLSNYTDGSTVTLDDFIQKQKVDFIKMDIEGEEYYALDGARKTIEMSNEISCVVCTYHHEHDYDVLTQLLQKFGFQTKPSRGYMWFPYDKDYIYDLPTLRRGLIRAEKTQHEKEKCIDMGD